jgi:ParB-like chromosome segregation protein Spo0J
MTDKPTAERPPESLQPHPKNNEIYGDRELTDETDKSFIQSIRENGVLTPILIDTDD